jgi:hypothetical protein
MISCCPPQPTSLVTRHNILRTATIELFHCPNNIVSGITSLSDGSYLDGPWRGPESDRAIRGQAQSQYPERPSPRARPAEMASSVFRTMSIMYVRREPPLGHIPWPTCGNPLPGMVQVGNAAGHDYGVQGPLGFMLTYMLLRLRCAADIAAVAAARGPRKREAMISGAVMTAPEASSPRPRRRWPDRGRVPAG